MMDHDLHHGVTDAELRHTAEEVVRLHPHATHEQRLQTMLAQLKRPSRLLRRARIAELKRVADGLAVEWVGQLPPAVMCGPVEAFDAAVAALVDRAHDAAAAIVAERYFEEDV